MEQLNLITNFLRIKDKNITIFSEYDLGTHLELHSRLDYTAPKFPSYEGQMATISRSLQNPPKSPI